MDQTPANSVQFTQLSNKEFNDQYWFNSLQMVEVINPPWYREGGQGEPVNKDFPFMVEMRHFLIRAGETAEFPGPIANLYLDQMSKIMAQNEDKLAYMTDPALRKLYYDQLIVGVRSLVQETGPNVPEYLKNVVPGTYQPADNETPPWQQNMERARDVLPQAPPAAPDVQPIPEPEKPLVAEPSEKSFEYDGSNYKMITNVKGGKQYYKDGKLVSVADYQKAASML